MLWGQTPFDLADLFSGICKYSFVRFYQFFPFSANKEHLYR
ncbi:hypothetical protein ykris0001_36650 [Yersinia kristensenii ATCC 33638]|nr:hypothetical protein ykris0001_19640 [Yersinia kristensenii ATCC 33638]EEP91112.1 hypothetical protein ykris0001_36650 [Yersinia kristensenii ATCC 33638]